MEEGGVGKGIGRGPSLGNWGCGRNVVQEFLRKRLAGLRKGKVPFNLWGPWKGFIRNWGKGLKFLKGRAILSLGKDYF